MDYFFISCIYVDYFIFRQTAKKDWWKRKKHEMNNRTSGEKQQQIKPKPVKEIK